MNDEPNVVGDAGQERLKQLLFEGMVYADRVLARTVLEQWAKQFGTDHLLVDLLLPVMEKYGEHYFTTDESPLSRGYVVARIAEDAIGFVSKEQTQVSKEKGRVILGNAEDDFHGLGRRIVGTVLKAHGYRLYDLGNDVTPELFVDKALEVDARIIGVSAMMYTTAVNIRHLRDLLEQRGLSSRLRLIVGGAIFVLRPELVKEVGADGTAVNALAVPALVEHLLQEKNAGDDCNE